MHIERPYRLRPSPYPGIIRDSKNGSGWWYYCVTCGHDYALNTMMNPNQAMCCTKPSLHIWSNEKDDPTTTTV
jgi:hypothetical protein